VAPGNRVAPSSDGFAVLGEVIERAAGVPTARFLADALFAPLGRHDTLRAR
jgi:CubicO group peptidase (beta-lactamase class C family)